MWPWFRNGGTFSPELPKSCSRHECNGQAVCSLEIKKEALLDGSSVRVDEQQCEVVVRAVAKYVCTTLRAI